MLIINHLNVSGPERDIDKIASAFVWGKPFNELCPIWPRENDRHEALLDARRKQWGTTDEAMKAEIIDVFPTSVAVEFMTVGNEPDKFIDFIAKSYPQLSGVCQFHLSGQPHLKSGVIKISGGKTFARTYNKPKPSREYA